jgi:hypothetical protein
MGRREGEPGLPVTEFREFRTRHVRHVAERQSLLPTIAGAIAAFAVGALAVVSWNYFPAPAQWNLSSRFHASAGPSFSGDRIGRATTAPLLKICLTPAMLGIRHEVDLQPGVLLEILEAGTRQGRLTEVLGAPREHAVLETAAKWGEVADCVSHQNTWTLCDIDNRALAVDAINAFVRQADRVISQPGTTYAAQPGEIHALAANKERVLASLKSQAQNGVLIAADFGAFVPTSVRQVLNDNKPAENGCAKK